MDKYIGRLLDNRYEIQEIIGTGGMAVVYKAHCHRLNRLVAIKILKDEYSQDEEFRRRFHAEGQAVAMLSHPNIVAVYDVSTSQDADYIVMELIDGISLKQYMEKKGILNWKETLHFGMQIGKALEHAHSRGIVHRDIKPHNIMVLKNGSVKVADFGIARVMSKSNTLTKEALGSVHYISPEQAKGGRVDNRSDLYSLGVVMYEMMAGRPPYDGESPVSVAIKHINGGARLPSVLNPNIPAGLEQIIMKAMSVNPNGRYSSATAMLYDMDEFRKEPTMLFDYGMGQQLEELLAARPAKEERTPKTTAERVVERKTDTAHRSHQAPENPRRRPPKEKEGMSDGSKAATIAIVACSVVASVAILIFLITLLNGGLFSKPPKLLEVPNLLNEDYEQVQLLEKYKDFEIVLWKSEHHEEYESGVIIEQKPVGGELVEDNKIYVVVSLGDEPAAKTMEDLVNVALNDAERFLTGQNFKTLVREEYSTDIKEGYITRTEPAYQEELEEGQTITLWVSIGKETIKANMPNVLGYQLDMALKILNASGFKDVTPVVVESNETAGQVVNQSVERNQKVDVTTPIILEISKGPEETTVPPPPVTEETTAPTEPSVRKRIVVVLPTDKTEAYLLSIRQEDEDVVDPIEMDPTAKDIEVEIEGTGIQYYSVYIDNELYQTIEVDFTPNG